MTPQARRRLIVVMALAALGVAGAWFYATRKPAAISGQTRADFVRSSTEGCIAKQKSGPDAKAVPAATIERYCACYSEKLADRITQSDLDRLTGATPEEMQSTMRAKMDESGDICSASTE